MAVAARKQSAKLHYPHTCRHPSCSPNTSISRRRYVVCNAKLHMRKAYRTAETPRPCIYTKEEHAQSKAKRHVFLFCTCINLHPCTFASIPATRPPEALAYPLAPRPYGLASKGHMRWANQRAIIMPQNPSLRPSQTSTHTNLTEP